MPASGYVPLNSPHPAEAMFSQPMLAAFEEGSSTKQQLPWRAGAHALYLLWLQNPNLRLAQQYQEQQAVYLQQKAQFDAAEVANPQPLPSPPQQPAMQPPQRPAKQKKGGGGGLFACFGCGGGDAAADEFDAYEQQQQQMQLQQQSQARAGPVPPQLPPKVARLSEEALRKLADGFRGYKNLPLSSNHPYWKQLSPR